MELFDLGYVLLVSLSSTISYLRAVVTCLFTGALALLVLLIASALVLTSVWIYVHVIVILLEYCRFVLLDIISYLSSWFASYQLSSVPNALEDFAASVKDEPSDDNDNDDDDIPPLRDPSPQPSEITETHQSPHQTPRSKPRESATRFAIIASAFPSEPRDKSLTPPYICDEYQCTFPYPCTEPRAKKPRNTSQPPKTLH